MGAADFQRDAWDRCTQLASTSNQSDSTSMPAPEHTGASPPAAASAFRAAQRVAQQRAADSRLVQREFAAIQRLDGSIRHSAKTATSRECASQNRYSNVLPYDYNRVILPGTPDYLNASHVRIAGGVLPATLAYVAAQGPLPSTAARFWRMVMSVGAPAVVMLTNLMERGVCKCAPYFPDQPGATLQLQAGLEVQVLSTSSFGPDTTLRVLHVRDAASGVAHTLRHFHMHTWPDHGVPLTTASIRAVCAELGPAAARPGPTVLHCSAGIGRTGTFCAVDVICQQLRAWASGAAAAAASDGGTTRPCSSSDGGGGVAGCGCCDSEAGGGGGNPGVDAVLSVPSLVCELRRQRMGMVQTLEQYRLIYLAAADELAELASNAGSAT